MLPRPDKKLAQLLPLLLILMQLGLSCHFHCANSYYDEKGSFHTTCTCSLSGYFQQAIADIHDFYSYSPPDREGKLVRSDSPDECPAIVVPFSRSRAPPV